MVAGEMPRPITTATRYRVSCLPPEDVNAQIFTIAVEQRADETGFRWAVTRNGVTFYDAEGRESAGVRWPMEDGIEREPVTEAEWDDYHRRYREWLDAHRFTEAEALGLARRLAPKMTYRGMTVADALKGYREITGVNVFGEGPVEQEHPQERSERAAEGPGEPEVLRWTGDNEEAVRDFLGDRYEKIRGGLDENDPLVVWFRSGSSGSSRAYLSWARPGSWLVRQPDGSVTSVEDVFYRGPR